MADDWAQSSDNYKMAVCEMKNITKVITTIAVLTGVTASSHAQVTTDFDQDGKSDVTFVKVEADKSLSWFAKLSTTGEIRSLGSLGKNGDQLTLANWNGGGAPSLGVVSLGSGNGIDWKYTDANGGTAQKSFGKEGDLVIAGARFDGNAVGDSAVVRLEKNNAVWRVVTDFSTKDPAASTVTFNFGKGGDRAFFVSLGDGVDWAATLGPGSGKNSKLRVRNIITGDIRSYNRLPKYASTGDRPRPFPLKQPTGPDFLAFQTVKGKTTTIRVIHIDGTPVAEAELDGTGVAVAGDFHEGPGEEIAFDNGTTLSILNPHSAEVREFGSTGGILADTINVNIVKDSSTTTPPTSTGGNDNEGGGGSTGEVASCNSVQSWPGGHIYKTVGSNHFTDVRRNTSGIILTTSARGPTPGCLTIQDSKGHVLAKMGLYARGAGWLARYYAGIGCGSGTPYNGSALAARARSASGSTAIYANFGTVCYGPIDPTKCIGSQQC